MMLHKQAAINTAKIVLIAMLAAGVNVVIFNLFTPFQIAMGMLGATIAGLICLLYTVERDKLKIVEEFQSKI